MLLFAALGSLSGTGCLIAEAPDYGEPRKTAPVIDQLTIDPKPYFRITSRTGDLPVPFTITVRSEDAGEALYAVPVLNYRSDRQVLMLPYDIPARAADQPKTLTIPLDLDALLPMGCHTVTIMVMHTSTFRASTGLPETAATDDDVASVTWWVDAETPMDDDEIKPCPTLTMGGM